MGDAKREEVSEYYSSVMDGKQKLQTNCCTEAVDEGGESCCCSAPEGFDARRAAKEVHPEVIAKSYGCGSPIPPHLLGMTVVDLGSGVGRDCFMASLLVGASGRVVGVDMTDRALELSRSYVEYHRERFGYARANVEFRKGTIEDTGLDSGFADVVISNCVINLCTDKHKVMTEVFRILKDGGEMYFSDVYANCILPDAVRANRTLWSECLSGAMRFEDFVAMSLDVGFEAVLEVSSRPVEVQNPDLAALLPEGAEFFSKTLRLFKPAPRVPDEPAFTRCEYVGEGREGEPDMFLLSKDCAIIKGDMQSPDPARIALLARSRYASFFRFE